MFLSLSPCFVLYRAYSSLWSSSALDVISHIEEWHHDVNTAQKMTKIVKNRRRQPSERTQSVLNLPHGREHTLFCLFPY